MADCPQCGRRLPGSAVAGLCPACLLKQGAKVDTSAPGVGVRFVPPSVEELRRQFPQLEILEQIGQGGMGAVYKARQPALDRLVALKILKLPATADPGFAERFIREAKTLARLSHPRIVAVHDYGQVDGMAYLILEFTVGHRADIYSLGVVFYELLTGELPLGRFAPPSAKVQVDVRLDEVVLRTLEKEPERRYQRAGQVKTDVETIATSTGRISGTPTGPGADGPRDWSRWLTWGLGVAVVVLLTVLLVPARPRRAWAIRLTSLTNEPACCGCGSSRVEPTDGG